jgi:hypothetical protein
MSNGTSEGTTGKGTRLDPKDVAAGTALGAAQRTGVGIFRRRRSEKMAGGAAAAATPRGRNGTGSRLLGAIFFVAFLVAMLVLMIRVG